METSVKAAEVLVPPQPEVSTSSSTTEEEAGAPPLSPSPAACSSSDPMQEYSQRLEEIISTYGSAASHLDKQILMEVETEQMKKEAKGGVPVAMETEITLILQSLNKLSTPAEKLEDLARKHAELTVQRRSDERKLSLLQQKLSILLDERQLLQADSRSSIAARGQLEALCRELQAQHTSLREETARLCKEDEEKRADMNNHFQAMLTEIQSQIELHSARNEKLCQENNNLTEKLESLMSQCELREESLEKINQRRDLQHKLTEAKLQQVTLQLTEAEEKHKREKEYLLREAIDKTKKCFAMKEQELSMKKKLSVYAIKFDEFQETLGKSNEIFVRFKQEMDNMTVRMKKMEKESSLWKTRFLNCNKALNDMMEERKEKLQEYEVFVLKIQKLEVLCRALQQERAVLYDKIKEIRKNNADIPVRVFGSSNDNQETETNIADPEAADTPSLLTPVEIQELQEIQEQDPVLVEGLSRWREEKAKLQELAASLIDTPCNNEDEEEEEKDDANPEDDLMISAFTQFQTKVSLPEFEEDEEPQEQTSKPEDPVPVEKPAEVQPTNTKPEGEEEEVKSQTKVEDAKPSEVEPTPQPEPVQIQTTTTTTDQKPEAAEAQTPVQEAEATPFTPAEDVKVEQIPVQQEAPTTSAPTSTDTPTPTTTPLASADTAKKQLAKKKKKRNGKNAS